MKVSGADREWVSRHFPGLVFRTNPEGEELIGEFSFAAAWDEVNRCYIINPTPEESESLIRIHDSYHIRIVIPSDGSNPKLYEIGERIVSFAIATGASSLDLHICTNGEACLVGLFQQDGIADLRNFIDGPVLQFFYDQTYHRRFGRWPRGQYSHGLFGAIESYFDLVSQDRGDRARLTEQCLQLVRLANDPHAEMIRRLLSDKKLVQGHLPCLCGSGRKLRACHETLFRGLWRLHGYILGVRNSD